MAVNAEVGPAEEQDGQRRVAVQKFGTFLSGMIMPNIAAFIAWGFITAFFIEKRGPRSRGSAGSASTPTGALSGR